MWALLAFSLPEGKYPAHLLLGSISLSDPWMIVFNLARVRQLQAGWCKLLFKSELSCSSQQEADRDLSGNHGLSADGRAFG